MKYVERWDCCPHAQKAKEGDIVSFALLHLVFPFVSTDFLHQKLQVSVMLPIESRYKFKIKEKL